MRQIFNFQFSIFNKFSNSKFQLGVFFLMIVLAIALPIVTVHASDSWPGSLIPKTCADTGECNLCDMLTVFMNIARWIFVLGGGGALIMMIIGAFRWVTSGGATEKIEGGKNNIIAAIVGLLIILLAWQIVFMVIGMMTGSQPGNPIKNTLLESWYAPFECKS